MNTIGTAASAGLRFIRRQASNPSIPGITASIRMMSGNTRSTTTIAAAADCAISTV
jgi:hypothetical protein